jgi:hypothetical protein
MEAKMAKVRSPNYPSLPLNEAIQAMAPVFRKDGRNKMSREVLAKNLGYSSLNGRALGKIGAVRAYGLIEGSGDDLKVSEDAITLLEAPESSPERAAAIRRCAMRSPLFSDLSSEFETVPSDDNLRYALIQRGFTSEGADKAASVYRETMSLISQPAQSSDSPEGKKDEDSGTSKPPLEQKTGMRQAIFPLDAGDATIQWPEGLTEENYKDLEDWIEIVMRKIKRSVVQDNRVEPASSEGNASQ